MKRLKQGDVSSFRELFDLYYLPLTVYALKFCDSFDLAEDIVQDLFVDLWEKDFFRKIEGPVSAYLFKSVRNNTLRTVKKQSRFVIEDIEDHVNAMLTEEKNELTDTEELFRKLHDKLETLPEKSRKVFEAIVLDNLKYKEVADAMGISVNTVKTHYSRALKHLRGSLDIIVILMLESLLSG